MTLKEALNLTKSMNVGSENELTFKAAVIFWIGANYGYDKTKTAKTTKYSESEVELILANWIKNEILIDGKIHGEFGDNEFENFVEIILIAMCGSGNIIRRNEKYSNNIQTNKFNLSMSNPKTLNEHLFAQLDRLSNADETTIKTEAEKSMHIIAISEQMLNVARLKLDILGAAQNLSTFSEIDSVKQIPENGNGNISKKQKPKRLKEDGSEDEEEYLDDNDKSYGI